MQPKARVKSRCCPPDWQKFKWLRHAGWQGAQKQARSSAAVGGCPQPFGKITADVSFVVPTGQLLSLEMNVKTSTSA